MNVLVELVVAGALVGPAVGAYALSARAKRRRERDEQALRAAHDERRAQKEAMRARRAEAERVVDEHFPGLPCEVREAEIQLLLRRGGEG